MKITSPLSPITRIKRGFGQDEINNILDLFPTTTLLVDLNSQRILMANVKAAELTAFTRTELASMTLDQLFVDYADATSSGNGHDLETSQQLVLIKHNKSTVEVQATIEEISADGRLVLLSLEPANIIQQRESERRRRASLLERLLSLSSAEQQKSLEAALNQILTTGQELTSSSILAVYQANGANLELERCAYLGLLLPERLPSQDLIYLRTAQVWLPGKRPNASVQSIARAAGFTYLASAPIGDPNAIIGLVIVADQQAPPVEQILPHVKLLASAAHNTIQRFTQVTNLIEQREKQLRYERFVKIAQDSIQDSIVVLTSDLRVLTLNHAAELSLGYETAEAVNLPVQTILIGNENLMPALRLAQTGIPTLNQDNIRLYRRSGQAFLARVSTLPVKQEDDLQGIVVLIQDLSEKEIAQSHAEQLEQHAILGTVTAIFAHEVRNPINNISTGLQWMAYRLPGDNPLQEQITKMQADCERIDGMMKSVLTYARTTEYEMEPVDLGMLISRLLDRLKPRLTGANVQPHLKVEPSAPLIMGNPRALEQVFTNLFTNAIQAMEGSGGVLAVKVQSAEATGKRQYALVVVADNGPGIPQEYQERIFQPFFTTKSSGTGLGLAITQRIVTAHKGSIQVNSFPGGTVFSVQLPAIQPNPEET
jgi:PAS domain S-box-containing protein